MGSPVGEGWAPPPAEPRNFGSPASLDVEEQRRGAAPSGKLPLTVLGILAGLFAILAADRERQRAEALLANLFAAIEAVAVIALLEAEQRVVDLVERLGLHLNERELDIFLNVRFGALDGV